MKQRTKKMIGIAVLGAAFAAVGTGSAGAAQPLAAGKTAGGLLKTLPVQEAARTLPAPGEQARTLPAEQNGKSPSAPKSPVGSLLGGLPLGAAEKLTALNAPAGNLTGSLPVGGLLG
ncbi:ATP-binding protein [Streptomyces desertarenae]|uniref:ATP-binding protein n=1 Tax=Streptomyces desertarenae TaxID=2666184 RepID=A0ABW4PK38_9ACTN